MTWELPDNERTYLRGLAAEQAEYAALPVMAERLRMWYDLNDGVKGARPPFIVETGTFDRDFMPESVYQCTSETGRRIERQLLVNIRNHELIDDDKVMPAAFDMHWFTDIDEFGLKIETDRVLDSEGVALGFRYHHPIKDLRTDFKRLKPVTCSVDRAMTASYKSFLEELFEGILPVAHRSGPFTSNMLTHRVIDLMGMEAFFMAMYDCPEELHRLMAYLRDNSLTMMKWAAAENLLIPNNGGQTSFGSSFNFTKRLPGKGFDPAHVRTSDMWGAANSQETVGVAPDMFHEFCFPYYRDVCAPLGLVYFGCCEPAHPFWNDLKQLPHIKKISISKWCDEEYMAAELAGTEIVYSRKPEPNFLSVDETLNEKKWADHIRRTLEVTQGIFVEFIVRDVYTVHGNLDNAKRCVQIARKEIDKFF